MTCDLSIITPAYNAAHTIADCLASVAVQTVGAEQLVIDGGSADGTLEVIGRFARPGLRVISEPDRGLYDAMNKGIARARGDIVGILNADDAYADTGVLARVRAAFGDAGVEACYGDLVYVKGGTPAGQQVGTPDYRHTDAPTHRRTDSLTHRPPALRVTRYWRAGVGSARSFYWGWMPPHPTFFVRRQVYARIGLYRLDLGTAADYEFMLRAMVKHGIRAVYIPGVMVTMRVGGISNTSLRRRWQANRMDRRAWRVNGLRPYPWTIILKPLRKVGQWGKGEGENAETLKC